MDYSIDDITERLDALVDKYLTRDDNGQIIDKVGYLRKTQQWGLRGSLNNASWRLIYEVPPHFESSTFLRLDYQFSDSRTPNFPKKGFYIAFEYVGTDLDDALVEFDKRLNSIPRKVRTAEL